MNKKESTKRMLDLDFVLASYHRQRSRQMTDQDLLTQLSFYEPLPAVAEQFKAWEVRILVALCRELQATAGTGPFPLSSWTVSDTLRVSVRAAARWLRLLVSKNVLALVKRRTSACDTLYRYSAHA